MDDRRVGVLGGGQLGRMLAEAAHRLNVSVSFLDAANAPAKQINAVPSDQPDGFFTEADDVMRLAQMVDTLTVEIEHIDTPVLHRISSLQLADVQPSSQTLSTIQDKYRQKEHLTQHGIPIVQYFPLEEPSEEHLGRIAAAVGYPFMLKSRTNAYDGRGNYPVKSSSEMGKALVSLANRPLYVERWAGFVKELAVMVVKTTNEAHGKLSPSTADDASTHAFPVVETIHQDSICKLTYAPARGISQDVASQARQLARRAVSTFSGRGVFGVELFLLHDSSLVVNEIAPRPHNSGHYTIEACHMSQYEAHLRAILPKLSKTIAPGATELLTPSTTNAIMLNILGGSTPEAHLVAARAALTVPGAKVHLYGKGDGRPGRKMGHITLIASSMAEAEEKMQPLIDIFDVIRADQTDSTLSEETILRRAKQLASERRHPQQQEEEEEEEEEGPRPTLPPRRQKEQYGYQTQSQSHSHSRDRPLIGITMGSDSDLPTLKPGLALLKSHFPTIPYEVTITSAHRTPDRMLSYARQASSRGIKVLIAAAGGAAHLPGMLASATPLPVIGVPVKASSLDGLDSLLSIVQMPRGVPVATVAVGNGVNAVLLALRVLAAGDHENDDADNKAAGMSGGSEIDKGGLLLKGLKRRIEEYMANMEGEVLEKADKMEQVGWSEYGQ